MGNGVEPKLTTHLLFRDVRLSHCDEITLGVFGKAIGGLATHMCINDTRVIAVDPLEGLTTNELGIKI